MVRRAGVCVPRGGIAAAGYASSTNLAGGYANSPGYAYGPGPGPAYGPGPGPAYGPGPGPGYASSTNLAGGYANSPGYAYGPGPGPAYGPGPGPAYGAGSMAGPPHNPGGLARIGNLCWSDRDPWANTGQGYWKSCQ